MTFTSVGGASCAAETVVYRLLLHNGDAADGSRRRLELGALARPLRAITADAVDEQILRLFEERSFLGSDLAAIRDRLRRLAPASCRSGAFALRFSTSLEGIETVPLAEVPMCIEMDDWMETQARVSVPPLFS